MPCVARLNESRTVCPVGPGTRGLSRDIYGIRVWVISLKALVYARWRREIMLTMFSKSCRLRSPSSSSPRTSSTWTFWPASRSAFSSRTVASEGRTASASVDEHGVSVPSSFTLNVLDTAKKKKRPLKFSTRQRERTCSLVLRPGRLAQEHVSVRAHAKSGAPEQKNSQRRLLLTRLCLLQTLSSFIPVCTSIAITSKDTQTYSSRFASSICSPSE